jgi:CIC family chloride channel protein
MESRRVLTRWVVLGTAIGVVAGVGAIVFMAGIELATRLLLGWGAGYVPPAPAGEGATVVTPVLRPWLLPVLAALGGLLSGLLVYGLAPEAAGHGTDAAVESFHHRGGRVRRRVPALKLIASAITIGSGGSGGREGPTAQISSGFGSALADWLHLSAADRRIALATGMGAGIGAIFRAPLGGAMMAAEVMYRHDLEVEALIPSLIASIVGYSIFGWWTGWSPVFGSQPDLAFTDPRQLPAYAALGLLCGAVGILYARAFYGTERLFRRLPLPRPLRPALGGLLVGLIGLVLPQALHTGYGWEQLGMQRDVVLGASLVLVLVLPLAKIVTTALSIGSGGSGGIFGPGMVIGGLLGTAFWRLTEGWVPGVPASPAPFVVVGMMALFGSIAHAPLAVMLMVAEMTGNLSLLAPAMIALGIATVVVGDQTIYAAQLGTRADSPAHRYRFGFPLLGTLPVRAAMAPPPRVLRDDASVAAAARALGPADAGAAPGGPAAPADGRAGAAAGATDGEPAALRGAPVLDGRGRFRGVVTPADLERVPPGDRPRTPLARVLPADPPAAAPNDTLDQALQQMAEREATWLPVVEPGTGRLLGVLTVTGALQYYRTVVRRGVRRMGSLTEGTTLTEVRVEPGTPLAWQRLAAAGLPPGAVVMAVRRHGEVLVPGGDTALQPGDVLTVVATPAGEPRLHEWLARQAPTAPAASAENRPGPPAPSGAGAARASSRTT